MVFVIVRIYARCVYLCMRILVKEVFRCVYFIPRDKYMVMESLEFLCACLWLSDCVKQVPYASNRCFSLIFCATLSAKHWTLVLNILFYEALGVEC